MILLKEFEKQAEQKTDQMDCDNNGTDNNDMEANDSKISFLFYNFSKSSKVLEINLKSAPTIVFTISYIK